MKILMKRMAIGIAVSLPVLAMLACVAMEQREVSAAQKAHASCVQEHSESHPDCVALEERLHAAQRRYQESSRRAWACDPAQEDCPTRR
jgi:hypothetical protein